MADNDDNVPQPAVNPITQLLGQAATQEAIAAAAVVVNLTAAAPEDIADLEDPDLRPETMMQVLIAQVNGSVNLKDQTIVIEYLRPAQRLIIPAGLGMNRSMEGNGRCTTNAVLRLRFRKIIGLTYAAIKELIEPPMSAAATREAVDVLQPAAAAAEIPDWKNNAWFRINANQMEARDHAELVMLRLSALLQFNHDIRDYGILNEADMSCTDGEWKLAGTQPIERLYAKMTPYTMQCIAALNRPNVGNVNLAAWVRASGLAMGLLPVADSKMQKEYTWTTKQPIWDHVQEVVAYYRSFPDHMHTYCLNLLAMFGLLHLSKDHTYKSNDSNMERIVESYLQCMRTAGNAALQEYLKTHREHIARTAQHPFGLGQTYWLAKLMGRFNALTPPLLCRVDVFPPPVQRLVICNVAIKEWRSFYVGKFCITIFAEQLAKVRRELGRIAENPPAFSSLASLYGEAEVTKVGKESWDGVYEMTPAVYSYIQAMHINDRNEKDGLGYAQSLGNVVRDQKGTISQWKNLWEKFQEEVDKMTVIQYLTQTLGIDPNRIPTDEQIAEIQ